jgi:hypothetical protein
VEVLRGVRAALAESGSVLVANELVEDEFSAPASDLDRYYYGQSVVSCLPGAMGDPQTAATRAVMRLATFRGYAEEAGFHEIELLPIQTTYWSFFRPTP